MPIRMLQRRGTTAEWAAANPVLGDGEFGVDKTAGIIKVGNGTDSWSELDIVYEATPAVLTVFGRTGDVTMTTDDIEDLTAVGAAVMEAGSPDDILSLLGASAIGTSILRAAGVNAVNTLLGVTTLGASLMGATTAATIRSTAGITQTGAAVATAVDAAAARTAIGAGTGNGNGNMTGTGVTAVVNLTQAAYDALATKSATTLYVIVG